MTGTSRAAATIAARGRPELLSMVAPDLPMASNLWPSLVIMV